VVVLASHFVNVVDDHERLALLRTCAHHARDDGVVLVQRYPPGWVPDAEPSRREQHGVVLDLHDLRHDGAVLHATMTYVVDGITYDQTFAAVDVDDERLASDSAPAGLVIDRVLDEPRTWVVLRPHV
jgi:hypothetical protein